MDVGATVRGFIVDNFYVADGITLDPAASLLDQGIVDSTGILEIISWLEDTFGIVIEDEEMIPANLDSIDAITRFVERKTS